MRLFRTGLRRHRPKTNAVQKRYARFHVQHIPTTRLDRIAKCNAGRAFKRYTCAVPYRKSRFL